MIRVSIRMSEELHEKLRWLAYKRRVSQHSIVLELLEKGLERVEVPDDARGTQRG